MARGTYSPSKRQREAEKARKKKEKAERRRLKRERGPGEIPVTTAEEITGALPTVAEAMDRIQNGGAARSSAPVPCRLFVGGLAQEATEKDLRQLFGDYGTVTDAFIVTDRDTGNSRGFGFVTMEDRKDAPKAIEELTDTELHGRHTVVNAATERSR